MVRTVLAIVENMQLGEVAEAIAIVEPQRRSTRLHRIWQRHVFPERLVGRGALRQEAHGIRVRRRDVTGVVVGDLVIVPGHDPGMRGVRRLQVAVGLVERIAVAELIQHRRPTAVVMAHQFPAPRDVVDVVADEQHGVQLLRRHVAQRGEIALLVLLARGEGKAQRRHVLARIGRGAGATDRACLALHREAVPVGPVGPQPIDFDMQRVRPARVGRGLARAHDLLQPLVLGDRPLHGNCATQGRRQRRCHEACPEHDARCRRMAGGHAQAERLRGERRLRVRRRRQP